MKANVLYKDESFDEAQKEIRTLENQDTANWFFNKWNGLTDLYDDTQIDKELRINRYLTAIRQLYKKRSEEMKMPHPGVRPFPEQKKLIESCPVFQILKTMPKCGLLHVHNVAALSPNGFLQLLEQWCQQSKTSPDTRPPIYILTKKDGQHRDMPLGRLFFSTRGINPGCYEPLSEYLKFPANTEWLLSLLSFRSVAKTDRVSYIWDEFNRMFRRTEDLFNLKEFYYEFHVAVFEEMIDNKIDYVELRSSLSTFSVLKKETNQKYPELQDTFWEEEALPEPWNMEKTTLITFLETLKTAKAEAVGDRGCKFDMRIILAARRDLDLADDAARTKLIKKLDSAILIHRMPAYQNLVIGFDFVSEEDRGQKTETYLQKLLYEEWGKNYPNTNDQGSAKNFLESNSKGENPFIEKKPRIQLIDLYLHDGESLWASNRNMYAAVVASRHRIGHGFLLAKYPSVVNRITEKVTLEQGIPQGAPHEPVLEVCPISNQLLRYYPDLRAHGAYDLMKAGIQCVLASDDPLLFDNADPTYDYWEAYIGMGLPFYAIKGLLFNSYYYRYLQTGGQDKTDEQLVFDFNEKYWIPFLNAADKLIQEKHWDAE